MGLPLWMPNNTSSDPFVWRPTSAHNFPCVYHLTSCPITEGRGRSLINNRYLLVVLNQMKQLVFSHIFSLYCLFFCSFFQDSNLHQTQIITPRVPVAIRPSPRVPVAIRPSPRVCSPVSAQIVTPLQTNVGTNNQNVFGSTIMLAGSYQ